MKQIETEIIIDQSIGKVWSVLMDFKNYPEWNPFVISIKGQKVVGKYLQIQIKTPKGKLMHFEPVVLKCSENDEFRWRGKLGIRGVFDGEHYFALEEISPTQTRFIHGEFFSGILVGFLSGMLKDTKIGFEKMNEAFKSRCESSDF